MRNYNRETEFRKLYEQHWHHVFAYVYNIISDQARAEDIVQEIFINLWNRYDALNIKEPRAYLLQAARFQSAKYFRDQKITHVQLEAVADRLHKHELESPGEETEQLLEQIAVKADSLLPERCRHVFKLKFYYQLSNKEIAEKLGLSLSTVENQINKALRLLRFSLNEHPGIVLVLALMVQGG